MEAKGNFVWFVAGAAIGASIALLYAPQSGRDTRRFIRKKSRQARETISDHEAYQALLDRFGQDFEVNKRALARKGTLLTGAYSLMLLAVIAEGVGKLM